MMSERRPNRIVVNRCHPIEQGEYDVPPCNPNTTRAEDCVHVLTRSVSPSVRPVGRALFNQSTVAHPFLSPLTTTA